MVRGQIQHVFVFIMLIIIAGVVLLLGYKFIGGLLGQSCDVEKLEFMNGLEKALRDYASYGTHKTAAFDAPCNALQLCMVSASAFEKDSNGKFKKQTFAYPGNLIIQDAVADPNPESPTNLFLVYEKGVTEPIQLFAEKLDVAGTPKVVCVNATSGRFNLVFDGKGRTVVVTSG